MDLTQTGKRASVSLSGVSLRVPMYVQTDRKDTSAFTSLLAAAFMPVRKQWKTILSDINLDLEPGDRLAVMGRNGAGKSTLLRILNGSFHPTKGFADIAGSRQALLNISLGFNNEATVRENIFLRGTAMGLTLPKIRSLVDDVLTFSDLGEKASHRFDTLSAGQCMRLGFAISTAVTSDILIMDEWIGTGDAEFIQRAKARMMGKVKDAKILVLASHSTSLLKDVCNQGIVLEEGKAIYTGDIMSSIKAYHDLIARRQAAGMTEPDVAAEVHGCVEKIELRGNRITVTGWAVSDGQPAKLFVLDVNGKRFIVEHVARLERNDVKKHMGLNDARCGFLISIALDDAVVHSIISENVYVFCGGNDHELQGPLSSAADQLIRL